MGDQKAILNVAGDHVLDNLLGSRGQLESTAPVPITTRQHTLLYKRLPLALIKVLGGFLTLIYLQQLI